MTARGPHSLARGVVAGAACLTVLAGCTEERVVRYKPFMSSLPGAVVGTPVVDDGGNGTPDALAAVAEPWAVDERTEQVTVTSKTVRDLINNLNRALDEDARDVFATQILSELTREEFQLRGYDPATAFDELKKRRRDVGRLFARMPAGEFTPGMLMRPVGKSVFRLEVRPDPRLRYTFMDVIFEKGSWRLRWFG